MFYIELILWFCFFFHTVLLTADTVTLKPIHQYTQHEPQVVEVAIQSNKTALRLRSISFLHAATDLQ